VVFVVFAPKASYIKMALKANGFFYKLRLYFLHIRLYLPHVKKKEIMLTATENGPHTQNSLIYYPGKLKVNST